MVNMFQFKASNYLNELELQINNKKERLELTKTKLVAIIVGDDKTSKKYLSIKQAVAEKHGISFEIIKYKATIGKKELIKNLQELSEDPEVTGIVLQYPLPEKYYIADYVKHIAKEKDIDIFNPENYTEFSMMKDIDMAPPVVKAVDYFIATLRLETKGKKYLLLGQGFLVGRPLIDYLVNQEASVISFNEYTEDIESCVKEADVVITATGKVGILKPSMLKKGASVIDFSSNEEGGDLDESENLDHLNVVCSSKDGMGPLTTRFLFINYLEFLTKKTKQVKIEAI